MDLSRAANYFSDTPVHGWDGTRWVNGVADVTYLPFDRFVSEREFGSKRRYVLCSADNDALDSYSVIKIGQEVFLVGVKNADVRGDVYSNIYLLHRATHFVDVAEFVKSTAASGFAKSVVRSVVGRYWADIERVTFSNSKEFDTIKFSQMSIYLPRDAVIDTDNEVVNGAEYYDIQEAHVSSGFTLCRALRKRSS